MRKAASLTIHLYRAMAINRRYLKLFFTLAAIIHSIKKNINHALPASVHVHVTRSIGCSVGTILNTSCVKASLTIEAALVLPFFIFVFLSLIYFINIMGLHTSFQIRLEETARKINSFAYICEDSGTSISNSDFLSSAIIRNLFLSDNIKDLCNIVHIKDGEKGIYFNHTKVDLSDQSVDIIITYDIDIPFIPGKQIYIPFVQRCRFKLFNGNSDADSTVNTSTIVYVTAHGTVYHTNKYCTYLIKYADIINKNNLLEYENTTGRNFTLCSACSKIPQADNNCIIYISKTGTVYHYSRDCYYLTSHIFEYNLKDVKEHLNLCSRCSRY